MILFPTFQPCLGCRDSHAATTEFCETSWFLVPDIQALGIYLHKQFKLKKKKKGISRRHFLWGSHTRNTHPYSGLPIRKRFLSFKGNCRRKESFLPSCSSLQETRNMALSCLSEDFEFIPNIESITNLCSSRSEHRKNAKCSRLQP